MATTEGPLDSKHWLLPVDDTPESMSALKWLQNKLYKPGDMVDIVHVVPEEEPGPPVWLGDYDMVLPTEGHFEQHVKPALHMVYSKYGTVLKESGALFRVHILRGHSTSGIAEAIADMAEKLNCEAIVMAHHHKSMITTWFLGSVCVDIVKSAKVPVVVIR